jgi:hypothetical protein
VDGRLDEPEWSEARTAASFTQSVPSSGAPATERTEARVLADDDALYVGVRLHDSRPDSIARTLARRDSDDIYSDWVTVFVDSYHDRRTAFAFAVNPAGVQADALHFNDVSEDATWDAVWESAVRVDSAGWSVELRIPYSQLRFGRCRVSEAACFWGLNLSRKIARRGETSYWAPRPPSAPAFVSLFGELGGVAGVARARRGEVVPFISASATRSPVVDADPFARELEGRTSVGADLRLPLPAGLTLAATVNPDFGQVEADPAVVNLSAFEVQFPERRPFFVEGTDIFRFGRTVTFNDNSETQFFYSRRIGRAPQRSVGAGAEHVDVPDESTILGAAKVSGRTAGGWSIGLLGATTARERARVADATGARNELTVEPLTGYLATRLRRDLRGGQTVLGGLLTAVHRDLGDAALADLLARDAVVAGADFEHSWKGREWTVSGFLAGSRVSGEAPAIDLLQRSSTRFFQRPDARNLTYDPTRRSLGGHFGALSVARQTRRVGASLTYEETSPGFEVNDAGFQTRADYRSISTGLQYRRDEIGRFFRAWSAQGYGTQSFDFDGHLLEHRYSLVSEGLFRNFWSFWLYANASPRVLSDRLTRGGPLAAQPAQITTQVRVTSDERRALTASTEVTHSVNGEGSRGTSVSVAVEVRPSSALRVRLEPGYDHSDRSDQYVLAVSDPLAAATFGRRYVLGDLRQRELSVSARLEWTFSPTLSFQAYAQPFVSAGRFVRFKELEAPRTFDFAVYGMDRGTVARDDPASLVHVDPDGSGPAAGFTFDDPDFTERSLRGNAVVRWEYRPGSTLFVVWQQRRSASLREARLGLNDDFGRLFRDPAENVLLVKLTYWLSR